MYVFVLIYNIWIVRINLQNSKTSVVDLTLFMTRIGNDVFAVAWHTKFSLFSALNDANDVYVLLVFPNVYKFLAIFFLLYGRQSKKIEGSNVKKWQPDMCWLWCTWSQMGVSASVTVIRASFFAWIPIMF